MFRFEDCEFTMIMPELVEPFYDHCFATRGMVMKN